MKRIIISLSIIAITLSCGTKQKIDVRCVYPNGVIYDKSDFQHFDGTTWFDIKYKGEIYERISVYDMDKDLEVGDTISSQCN